MKTHICYIILFSLLYYTYCQDLYVKVFDEKNHRVSFFKSGVCVLNDEGIESRKYECKENIPAIYQDCTDVQMTCSITECSCIEGINFNSKGYCYRTVYENDECFGEKNVIEFVKFQTCVEQEDDTSMFITKRDNNLHVFNYADTKCSIAVTDRPHEEIIPIDVCSENVAINCDIPEINEIIQCDKPNSCKMSGDIKISEPIIVNVQITIQPETKIKLTNLEETIFIVEENGKVDIDGGTIIIDIENDESFNEFITLFKNDEYDLKIIDGSYEGRFDGINVDISKDVSDCTKVDSSLDYRDDKSVHAMFKLNKSKCGLKWWVILLICEGIFLVVFVFILLVIFNKTLRRKILPFRDRKNRR